MKKYLRYVEEIFFLCGKDAKKIPLMAIAFLISSFMDLAGIGLIVPYISLIINPGYADGSRLFSSLKNFGFDSSREGLLIGIGLCLVLVFLIKTVLSYLISRMIFNFSHRKAVDIRAKLIRSYQEMRYVDYVKRNSSDYIYSVMQLAAIFAESSLQNLLRIFSEGIVVTAVLVYLLFKNGIEVGVFATLMVMSLISFDLIFRRRLLHEGRLIDQKSREMVQGIHEAIDGLKEIRILGKESYFFENVIRPAQAVADARTGSVTIKTIPRYWLELVLICFVVGLVYAHLTLEQDVAALTSTLGMFGVAAMRLVPSFNQIITGLAHLSHNRNSVHLLYNDLKRLETAPKEAQTKIPALSDPFISVELKDVSYSYENTNRQALKQINLKIKRGDIIGFMGPSGAGKSTLVDLLLGLLHPSEGQLHFNGEVLTDETLGSWIQNVAYIPQQIFLVDDTLEKNVALGTHADEIDKEKVLDSLKKSNLSDFLSELPAGLNTRLGERGVRLSGGQRQRVAIARTFYYNRDVLVMDEATSALDNETEHEIVEEVRQLKGTKTILLIAHRLTTLKYCNLIYKIENGQIVACGSYSDLVTNARS